MEREHLATFRFFGELNDFLPKLKKGRLCYYRFDGNPSIKDAIEALGIPHVEVSLVLRNGEPTHYHQLLKNEDAVSVYPAFLHLDITSLSLQPELPSEIRFVLDVHLGKLCKYLRLLGFDTVYQNNYDDPEIIDISLRDDRIILTRDIGLLKVNRVKWGYWIRSQQARYQLKEVMERYKLSDRIEPFNRCVKCNGLVEWVDKNTIIHLLKPMTQEVFSEFYRCKSCGNIYWEGSHYDKMQGFIDDFSKEM